MHRTWVMSLTTVFAVLALVASTCLAGKFNRVLNIGDPAPDFSGIIGVDDQKHSLSDFADAKAVVVLFTCNHCPVAMAVEDRVIALQKDYQDKGVRVVAINVNNDPADRLDKMKERSASKGFNFPYIYDPTQQVARDYGATVTPHVFLLDGERRIAYMGLIDDEPLNEAAVQKHYLRDAIDAVLAGSTPAVTETKQKGCGIQYE